MEVEAYSRLEVKSRELALRLKQSQLKAVALQQDLNVEQQKYCSHKIRATLLFQVILYFNFTAGYITNVPYHCNFTSSLPFAYLLRSPFNPF